jgi:transposase
VLIKQSTTNSLTVLRPNAAGIDIGSRTIHVALPPDRFEDVHEFGTFTRDLHAIAKWLLDHEITTVSMESTSVYWIPLFQILETCGIEVFLVNARHVKAVPGRKTDIKDSQWLQYLHSVGLLQASFRPNDEIVAVRSLVRHRDNLVKSITRQIHHMQKSLTQMNVQLHNVISDISGVTGLAIIDALLSGQYSPAALAELKDRRIKASKETIAKSLEGDFRTEHLFTLRQSRDALRFTEQQLIHCDQEIQRAIDNFNREQDGPAIEGSTRTNTMKKLRLRDARDQLIHKEMYRAFGIDLFELPGFATETVLCVFSEVGPNFTKFRSAAAFASWLALCPDREITGGKVKRTRTRTTKSRLAAALRQAAYSLANAKSYYGDLYRRLRAKFGAPKAVKAMANRLARLLYYLVTTKQQFDETKFAAANARHAERQLAGLKRKAASLGFTLLPTLQQS